ncbi:MAG: PorV/PorQ family protein [Bacteroidetes bacterium]|nr:PorV/PorQ family protein [Bacteroidota bacterium]
MKKILIKFIGLVLLVTLIIPTSYAGNKQRVGQAGAGELLINPWARSSGFAGANVACITGFEAIFVNVAGTALTHGTDLVFSRTNWLKGTEININAFGFSQRLGESGVLSLSVMSMDFGEIAITTVELPDGGLGTYHPQYTNITLAFAKEFSNSIYGGFAIKVVNEGISNLSASGIALDAGIQYVTGAQKQIHFGITMKNVGPTMKFSGDGMSFRGSSSDGPIMTVEQRSADFELPSLIKIAFAYDINFAAIHKVTMAGNFTSNSFTKDQINVGLQYNYHDIVILRGGYAYEEGIFDTDNKTTAYTGPTAGASVQIPFNKEKGQTFSIDYSYRPTDPFDGTHSLGVKISL